MRRGGQAARWCGRAGLPGPLPAAAGSLARAMAASWLMLHRHCPGAELQPTHPGWITAIGGYCVLSKKRDCRLAKESGLSSAKSGRRDSNPRHSAWEARLRVCEYEGRSTGRTLSIPGDRCRPKCLGVHGPFAYRRRLYITAGLRHLDGTRALKYAARTRRPDRRRRPLAAATASSRRTHRV